MAARVKRQRGPPAPLDPAALAAKPLTLVPLLDSDWLWPILSFLSFRERWLFAGVSRSYWVWMMARARSAAVVWRHVDLRAHHLRGSELIMLLGRIGHYVHSLTFVAQPTYINVEAPASTPSRHVFVEWLLQHHGARLPHLLSLGVIGDLDEIAALQFALGGVTTLFSWAHGTPSPGFPRTVMAPVTTADGSVELQPRPVIHNGLAFDEQRQQWAPTSTCSAAGRAGMGCTEEPKFSRHMRVCDWCQRASCRHCRPVHFRTRHLLDASDRPRPLAEVETIGMWLCTPCVQQCFTDPGVPSTGPWGDCEPWWKLKAPHH